MKLEWRMKEEEGRGREKGRRGEGREEDGGRREVEQEVYRD